MEQPQEPPPSLEPGRLVDRVTLPVEAGRIRELARATGATDPAHAGGLATLTHVVTAAHLRDQRAFVAGLGLDITRIVVGGVSWEYARPLRAGDVLDAVRRVESDERREGRSGPLRLVVLATEFTDQHGVVVVTQRETLVERGRAA
jgi:hypothetical protein